jgi:hypothetical protein
MSQIEFTSTPGKSFVAVVKNPAADYATLATGISCTEVSAGRYRANLGSLTGLVWIEATSGATKSVGFADLSNPAANGYSDVVDVPDRQTAIIALLTSGSATTNAPVTPTGTITNIVIGDDYKAASGRAFNWLVAVPVFSQSGSKCFFGGSAKHKGEWLVEGTIIPVTVDSVPKWKLQFELSKTDTEACKPGCYDWSAELRGPAPEQITKIIGKTELIEAYTR